MTPRFQTLSDNCIQACIASILDLPLDAVPHVFAKPDWFDMLSCWAKARGYTFVVLEAPKRSEVAALKNSGGYYIGVVPISSEQSHAVVMRRGKIVFDPEGGQQIHRKPFRYFVFERQGGLTPAVQAELKRWLGPLLPA